MLAGYTELDCIDFHEQPDAQLLAYQRIIKQSGVVLAVYAPDLADGSAEDKAVSYALALGRPVMLIHPETLKTKWLNVPTEKGPRIDCPATKITGLILWNDLHFRQGLYNKLKRL